MSKPKVLYVEMLEDNYGNKRLDDEVIRSLNTFCDVIVCGMDNWYLPLPDSVHFEKISYKNYPKVLKQFAKRYWVPYQNVKMAGKLFKKCNIDNVIFASYHLYVSALLPIFFKDLTKVYVMNHNNIDYMDVSKIGNYLFKLYGTKVNHIVFEEFILEYIYKRYDVSRSMIHVIPHPMNRILDKKFVRYDCVGISNSNDEEWIKAFIAFEKSSKMLINNNLRVILRSKNQYFDDGALNVINGFLSDEEYYDYICSSKYILILFPKTFRYRMSGTIVDALSNNIPVIGTDIPLIRSYAKKYDNIVYCIDRPEDIMKILIRYKKNVEVEKQFLDFKKAHSFEVITNLLKKMLLVGSRCE